MLKNETHAKVGYGGGPSFQREFDAGRAFCRGRYFHFTEVLFCNRHLLMARQFCYGERTCSSFASPCSSPVSL